ncbi:hypothetical protein [Eubacterium ramulus]
MCEKALHILEKFINNRTECNDMGRDTNVEIFKDTANLVKTNPVLKSEVAASTKKQEIILETDKVEAPTLNRYTENARVIISKYICETSILYACKM